MRCETIWRVEKAAAKALVFGFAVSAGLNGEPRFLNNSEVAEPYHESFRCTVYDQNVGKSSETRTTFELPKDLLPAESCVPIPVVK